MAWLQHAHRHFHSAQFIAKMDDDAYLHVPDLLSLLRVLDATEPAPGMAASSSPMLYLGKLACFHWHADIFEHAGFGWTYGMAHEAGAKCRNRSRGSHDAPRSALAPCVGPFPFATGFLAVLSLPLVSFLANTAAVLADSERLARTRHIVKRGNKI